MKPGKPKDVAVCECESEYVCVYVYAHACVHVKARNGLQTLDRCSFSCILRSSMCITVELAVDCDVSVVEWAIQKKHMIIQFKTHLFEFKYLALTNSNMLHPGINLSKLDLVELNVKYISCS